MLPLEDLMLNTRMAKWSAKRIKQSINSAAVKLELDFPLKSKQVDAITAFVSRQDYFVSLPTGYGKSLCFVLLPLIFDFLHGRESSLVICVSPLIALMVDQVAKYSSMGLRWMILMVDQAVKYSSMGLRCAYVDAIDGRPGSEVLLNGFKVYVHMWMILMVDQAAKYSSMGLRCTCICG